MNYNEFKRAQKRGIIVVIFLLLLKIASVVALVWLLIFAVNSIGDSLKENNTTFVKELGKEWGEVKSQFNEGVEETDESR